MVSPSRKAILLELLLIAACVLWFTPNQRNFDPDVRPVGYELSYLANSGIIAAQIYEDSGKIPLWNPYLGEGEPIFESPFSYLFNPLMTAPFFFAAPMQAVKIVFLMHIFIAAVGGWVLGYVLDFQRAGRVLLALLLAANGSIVGQMSEGIFPMANSLAYVPLVYASLFGTLYREGRRWVILLVVAASLMTFAGTYWHLLPTAISALVFTVFALMRQSGAARVRIASRVLWAGALTVGVTMVRVLPQIIHREYVGHPTEDVLSPGRFPETFIAVVGQFFTAGMPERFVGNNVYYHYIVHPLALLVLIGVAVWLYRRGARPRLNWRVAVPALGLIVFYAFWAQGATGPVRFVYDRVLFLQEWRILGRMLAAATPLIAVLVVMLFDAIGRRVAETPVRYGLALLGVFIALDVLGNYNRITGVQPMYEVMRAPLVELRIQHPDEFLRVETESFFYYLPIYEIGARASYGNPDYRPIGIAPTISRREVMDYLAEYAVDFREGVQFILDALDYEVLIPERDTAQSIVWVSETVPTYAYMVDPFWLAGRDFPLTRDATEPVTDFTHYHDRVRVIVPPVSESRLLVITETAYPGWQVTINGQSAPLESVGELLGVRLPVQEAGAPPNVVEFRYRPVWLFRGAWVSLFALLVFGVYALRVDTLINRLFGG